MAQALLDDASACSVISWIHTLYIYHNVYHIFCQCNLSAVILLHVCPSWERDPSSVALPEVFPSFFFFSQYSTGIEGLRTEDAIHCTDCKAH